ncbi:TPA: isocyanide synthase family protein [Serratia marcescens]|nr:isocyanide synthase family protein [Serratia marcescens]
MSTTNAVDMKHSHTEYSELQIEEIGRSVISSIFQRRCIIDSKPGEEINPVSEEEITPHLERVMLAIASNRPIEMVLPAFPGKSPNRKKTLSHLPDYAERCAIDQLNRLCEEIRAVYPRGAKIKICSDGYVFSDVVKIPDNQVKDYTDAISEYCSINYPDVFSMYDLIDEFKELKCLNSMREELIVRYGVSFMTLKMRVKEEKEAGSMYKGITRFLCEDYSGLSEFEGWSNTQIQKAARAAAYRVMQRSEAWSELLNEKFPNFVRLSIHPQFRVSKKIGIKLVPTSDLWRTPWHSVAVKTGECVQLERRSNVDERFNSLVFNGGMPCHYVRLSV